MEWYPQNKEELQKSISLFLDKILQKNIKKINGIIVPHAGYIYSGSVAGSGFSYLKKSENRKAIIFLI